MSSRDKGSDAMDIDEPRHPDSQKRSRSVDPREGEVETKRPRRDSRERTRSRERSRRTAERDPAHHRSRDKYRDRPRDRNYDRDRHERDLERGRDRIDRDRQRDRRDESRKDSRQNAPSVGGGGDGSGGLRDMQANEMNALRANLGLPPLETGPKKKTAEEKLRDKQKQKERELEQKARESQALEDKLAALREKRLLREKQKKKISTLGDPEDEEEDAKAWAQKQKQKREEMRIAEEKAKKIQNLMKGNDSDSESSLSDDEWVPQNLREKRLQKKQQRINTGDVVAGARIGHDFKDIMSLKQGEVLTLKDRDILVEGEGKMAIDEEADELENLHMTETETVRKHDDIKKGKDKYNPYEEQGLLHQYDEEEKKEFYEIDETGAISNEEMKRQREAEIQRKLKESTRALSTFSGESAESKPVADFYSLDEMVAFKKKRKRKSKKGTKSSKKRKKRTNLADELVPLSSDVGNDFGSRASRQQKQKDADVSEVLSNLRKRENYKLAIQKAERESATLAGEDEEEDEQDLVTSLSASRRNAFKKNNEDLLKALQQAPIKQEEKRSDRIDFDAAVDSYSSIVASNKEDEDEEFMTISEKLALRKKRMRQQKNQRKKFGDNILEKEKSRKQEDRERKDQVDRMEVDEKPQDQGLDGIVGPEAHSNFGIAATLNLLKTRGGIKSQEIKPVVGRSNDYRENILGDQQGDSFRLEYLDEDGREMTPSESFRRLSYKFHGISPGPKQIQKRLDRLEKEKEKNRKVTSDSSSGTMSALQKTQRRHKTAHLAVVNNTDKIVQKVVSEHKKK